MNIKKKTIICNLFSDFILEKIGLDTNTKIQVTDCSNFYTINGDSNSLTILNINETVDEFNSKFKTFLGEDKILRTIDLINYGAKLNPTQKLKYKFYNTENCLYPKDEINDTIKSYTTTSTFPHGYSFLQGRSLLYKLKNIAYNVFKLGYIKWLNIEMNCNEVEDDIINITHNLSPLKNDFIKSAILDVFDMQSISDMDINKYDIYNESLKITRESPKIKKLYKDFIVM